MKLTLPQQDIYFEQLLFPDQPIYNIGAKIAIDGPLNLEIFKRAYTALIHQHDAYRCHLEGDIDTVEMVMTHTIRPLEFMDFSRKSPDENSVSDFMQREFKKPFNLEQDPFLYRFVLIKTNENFHYLFSVYHHIITDGWGTSLMFTRLVKNYNEILESGKIISEYPYPYENFVVEDKKYFDSPQFEEDKQYWLGKFRSLPENLFERSELSEVKNKSRRKELMISRQKYNELIQLASDTKSTTFHIILAILYAYFRRKSQNNTISIGLPVLNRSGAKFKKTVGLMMGVNPLLISIDENDTIIELIGKIKTELKQDYRHQRFPLGQLVKELVAFHQKEQIFNITLSYEKQDYSSHFSHTKTEVIPLSHESERVALALYIREFDEKEDVKIDFDYNISYWDEKEIRRLVKHFQELLTETLINRDKKIKDLCFLTEEEQTRLLVDFNHTNTEYQKKTVIELFDEQTIKFPDQVAVRDSEASFTYGRLKEKSEVISSYLTAHFGNKSEPIGVLVNRSAEMIAVLLGILRSGKSYIPIDPSLPVERIAHIISQSQTAVIVSEEALIAGTAGLLPVIEQHQVHVIDKKELLQQYLIEELQQNNCSLKDTAYIIYTSGSTGIPKGVEIGHQALTNFLASIQKKPGITAEDILYSVTTSSFDISILEFFAPLASGGSVFIANKETLGNTELLKEELNHINPTIIQATPSFYQMLFSGGWEGSKNLKVLCGGDSLNEALAAKLIQYCKEIWNMYGPTETTIWSAVKKIEKPSEASCIGAPIDNTQIYIIDENKNLLPVNTTGRIFISGDGLAKGYYKNEFLTSEKFINNPFAGLQGTKMYDTGDLGKWTESGEIKFLGRNDFQVKIRGFRIELGEIEAQLQNHADIEQVVAEAKEINDDKVLVAYYTEKNNGKNHYQATINKTSLRKYLQSKLPGYMIPGYFVKLESIPLTPNGKINRKALPNIFHEDVQIKEYVAPESDMEKKIAEVWQQALGIEKIGITDSFFELGGHSLIAGKIANSLSKELDKNVSMKQIFQNPTIQTLAKDLRNNDKEKVQIPKATQKDFYALTSDQMNIWLASQKEDFSNAYNMYSFFELDGHIENEQLEKSVQSLIDEHEILRTNFTEKDGEVHQLIRQDRLFVLDIENVYEEDLLPAFQKYVTHTFDLENELLIKIAIFNGDRGKKYLFFLTHHIIVDGSSLEIMISKLIEIYNHTDIARVQSAVHFKDYAEWLKSFPKKELQEIDNIKTKVLHNDNALGQIKERYYQMSLSHFTILKEFSGKNKSTIFTINVALLGIVLGKIYQQKKISFGTVFSGRNTIQLEKLIGMFVKTLPLSLELNENLGLLNYIKSCQNKLDILEENMLTLPAYHINEITDFVINYQHSDRLLKDHIDFGSFSLKKKNIQSGLARFPVVFNFFEADQLICQIEHSEHIDPVIIDLIWEKFLLLIDQIPESPDKNIASFDLLTTREKQIKDSVDISFDF
ncbi:amino acid adenylation domain-containing protein [Chryseobacterium sp. G0240]|uniref:non-ribosomal peptide synthetase n=1 Tax=Chryseobacterium sp. G0240 TaxID=2487066 RepID=UPI000F447FC6|nr:non-ribosomal peptide synthetase [Chryseobacterium sp. G0240]ROI04077.1 amino acid adenylation domain-containing protein [Chryseobacterium sp. G0240]